MWSPSTNAAGRRPPSRPSRPATPRGRSTRRSSPRSEAAGFSLGVLNPLSWFGGAKEQKPRPGDKIAKLEAEWHGKLAAIYERWKQVGEEYSDVPLTPHRQDVQVTAFGLAWAPFWQVQAQPG